MLTKSDYMPKVGDRVRATLGENVLVGEVALFQFYGTDFYVRISISSADTQGVASKDGWRFEQIVEVPTKFGAVIRNNVDGQLYVRYDARTTYPLPWVPLAATDEVATTLEATAGGFTVLFEGVDE